MQTQWEAMTMANGSATPGTGWISYAGIMMVIAGVVSIFDGIWAFRHDDLEPYNTIFWGGNLTAWGWVWLIVGVLLIVAGFSVFQRVQWARWFGVVAAGVAVLANLTWTEVQPMAGLIGVLLASLVIYGLVAYGDEPEFA